MKTPRKNVIVTADDFGISPGVNRAVLISHNRGSLTHASLMANGKHLKDAIILSGVSAPNLKLGLHINLTSGKPVLKPEQVPDLVDEGGNFKYGPVGLLLQIIVNSNLKKQITAEITAQINKLKKREVQISHLDGHHHVHMIPGIFPLVVKLAKEFNIPRIRVVNESLVNTMINTRKINFLWNGGFARYVLLKTMCRINNYKTDTYFFSILYSCKITPELLENIRIPKGFVNIEIMLHPGVPEMDAEADTGAIYEREHLTSPDRVVELGVALKLHD